MLTIDQIISHIEEVIAHDRLTGDHEALRRTQYAAGMLMRAAENAGDKSTAKRFQLLAAQAANKREEIIGDA